MDKNGKMLWLKKVWTKRPGGLLKKPALSVCDQFKAHVKEATRREFRELNMQLAVILGVFISQMKLLDALSNKPFKAYKRTGPNVWKHEFMI
jgi:hypothetical protein